MDNTNNNNGNTQATTATVQATNKFNPNASRLNFKGNGDDAPSSLGLDLQNIKRKDWAGLEAYAQANGFTSARKYLEGVVYAQIAQYKDTPIPQVVAASTGATTSAPTEPVKELPQTVMGAAAEFELNPETGEPLTLKEQVEARRNRPRARTKAELKAAGVPA